MSDTLSSQGLLLDPGFQVRPEVFISPGSNVRQPYHPEGSLNELPNLAATYNGAKPAQASSVLTGYENFHAAANLNDGLYGNGSAWVANAAGGSVVIDLGIRREIDRASFGRDHSTAESVYTDRGTSHYSFSVSIDGVNWTEMVNQNIDPSSMTHGYTFDFQPTQARYVRFEFASPVGGGEPAIDEIGVYNSSHSLELAERVANIRTSTINADHSHIRAATKWNHDITYAIEQTNDSSQQPSIINGIADVENMTDNQVSLTRQAFTLWGELINRPLVETETTNPNIGFNYSNHPPLMSTDNDVTYHNYIPGGTTSYENVEERTMTGANIYMNSSNSANLGSARLDFNYQQFLSSDQTSQSLAHTYSNTLHEIGHALGLTHSGFYNGTASPLQYDQDTTQWSVMAYQEPNRQSDWNNFSAQTPMLDDIVAMWLMYGRNTTTRNGDTTYGYNSTAGINDVYNFDINRHPVLTIYDADGVDTLDFSRDFHRNIIDMRDGGFSSVSGLRNNLAIAYGTNIENAVCGTGGDTVWCNRNGNTVTAGSGNDIFHANDGADNFKFRSLSGQDTIFNFNEHLTVSSEGARFLADRFTFSQNVFADFQAVMNHAVDDGNGNTIISDGNGNSITIENLMKSELTVENFVFINDLSTNVIQPEPENLQVFGSITHDGHSPGGQVFALYEGLLGREPDPIGLEFWAAQFSAGVTPNVLAAQFLASPEGQARSGSSDNAAFLTQLYETTLHREPDAYGLSQWVTRLDEGMSRGDVGAGFALSEEHLDILQPAYTAGVYVPDAVTSEVARIYYTVLGREPDAHGLAHWSDVIHAGTPLTDLTASFLQAPEVIARTGSMSTPQYVDFVYSNALGRHAEQTGLDAWVDRIDNGGQSRVDVTTAIGQSAEAQGHLMHVIETGWHLL